MSNFTLQIRSNTKIPNLLFNSGPVRFNIDETVLILTKRLMATMAKLATGTLLAIARENRRHHHCRRRRRRMSNCGHHRTTHAPAAAAVSCSVLVATPPLTPTKNFPRGTASKNKNAFPARSGKVPTDPPPPSSQNRANVCWHVAMKILMSVTPSG